MYLDQYLSSLVLSRGSNSWRLTAEIFPGPGDYRRLQQAAGRCGHIPKWWTRWNTLSTCQSVWHVFQDGLKMKWSYCISFRHFFNTRARAYLPVFLHVFPFISLFSLTLCFWLSICLPACVSVCPFLSSLKWKKGGHILYAVHSQNENYMYLLNWCRILKRGRTTGYSILYLKACKTKIPLIRNLKTFP